MSTIDLNELYNVVSHAPGNVGFETDNFINWSYYSATPPYWDGDFVNFSPATGQTEGYIEKTGLSIDASIYKYCIVCVRGTGGFFVQVYDGVWKNVASEAATSHFRIRIFDLSGITTGTITAVRCGCSGGDDKSVKYDFIMFASSQIESLLNLIEVLIRQKESDLDDFEISKDGGTLNLGRHIRVWLNGTKVFAGVTEEVTPEDAGILHVSGRCFGQKLLLRAKSKTFNIRELSAAVKDFVEDLPEITTLRVDSPSPAVYITKDYKYEYIVDGIKDLAKQSGSDREVKLGMGHDLRFRSRANVNIPTAPPINESDGKILQRGVRRETDAFRLFNKVTVVGGELSNIDNDPDKYSDEGDISTYIWQIFGGGGGSSIQEHTDFVKGKRSMKCYWTLYSNTLMVEFNIKTSGSQDYTDLSSFTQLKFAHKSTGIAKYPAETNFYCQSRLVDTAGRNATQPYLGTNVQPPSEFAEIILKTSDYSLDSGFDWTHVKYVQWRIISDRSSPGEGVGGEYWLDHVRFYTANLTKTATDSASEFKHTREYVYRDEKLLDPGFTQEVANALLAVLKSKENRFRLPIVGTPDAQIGHKVTVNSPTHGLSGTYYIVEAEHKVTPREGYVTEVTLEKPRLSLETLLAEAIERKIKLIERGGIA